MGRGSSGTGGSGSWKKKLRQYAKNGKMPKYIMGDKSQQAEVLKEIDKLYSMPDTNAKITDQGDGVTVEIDGKVYKASYPSGDQASEAEKQGAIKHILHSHLQENGKAAAKQSGNSWKSDYDKALKEAEKYHKQAQAMDAQVKAAKDAYYKAPTRSKAQKQEAERLEKIMNDLSMKQAMLQNRSAQLSTFADNLRSKNDTRYRNKRNKEAAENARRNYR